MGSSKYRNVKTKINGYTFDSKKEAKRYQELLLLIKAGEITNLTVHPKFVLQEGFIYRGRKIQPITYTADFTYHINDPDADYPNAFITVVEDVKGGAATQTQLFKVKVKMLKKRFPELDFRIVED